MSVDFHLNLQSETVAQIDSGSPICVEPSTTLSEVLQVLREQNRGAVLVCQSDQLVGIFTERDALQLMARAAKGETFPQWNGPISEVMIRQPVTTKVEETVGAAITKMSQGGYRRLPIVDDESHPVGILKVSSLLNYLVEHFPNVVYTLPPSPHHNTQEREGA